MSNTKINDAEFGIVTVRRSRLARHVKLTINQRGGIHISMPPRAPLLLARTLLSESRSQIRKHLTIAQNNQARLTNGSMIGKSHRLVLGQGGGYASRLAGTELHVTVPDTVAIDSQPAQQYIKEAALKALRTQSKAYLSRRIQALAHSHGFRYSSLRFSNAGTRWGSCSSSGTISLNIWLMQLPFELIDYVLIHELSHTEHMNHSPQFWQLVENIIPDYRERRRALKAERPFL